MLLGLHAFDGAYIWTARNPVTIPRTGSVTVSELIYTVVEGDRPHGSLYINFKVINNETQEEEIETFRINERIDRLVDDESGNPV